MLGLTRYRNKFLNSFVLTIKAVLACYPDKSGGKSTAKVSDGASGKIFVNLSVRFRNLKITITYN